MSTSNDDIRHQAERRVKAKQNFWRLLGTFTITFLVLVAIWALSVEHKSWNNFWPVWALIGMGIALAYSWLAAYGPGRDVTQRQIDDEMRRMQGGA